MKNVNKYKNIKFFIFKIILILYFLLNLYQYIKISNYLINKNRVPKVSIFMPIYNKEQYLKESIGSIQHQTLKNIEIILVNDFSSDNSLKIIKKLSKNDDRIKIVNNDRNHGLLYSRAMGIINCTGEYVINLDPDDKFSSSNNLEILYNKAKRFNIDTILFLIKTIKKNDINKKKNINPRKLYELNNSNFMKIAKDFFITNKFIKREIILKCFNSFKEKIYKNKWNYHEDNIWSLLIHKYSKNIIFFKKFIYLYFQNKESLMHNLYNILQIKNIIYRFEVIQKIFNYKNYYHLNLLLKEVNKYYKGIIKKDNEVRRKIINILNNFIYENINNSNISRINHIKNLISNNKIIIINRLLSESIEKNILYLTIYNFLQNYIKKKIVIVNGNNKNDFEDILQYVNIKDILVIFEKEFSNNFFEYLKKLFPNNKILFFIENIYFLSENENYNSSIKNNYTRNLTIKKYINRESKFYGYYIKDYLINLSKFFYYKNYISKNNILIAFHLKQTDELKKKIINIISNHLSNNITFIDNLSSKIISQRNNSKLINLFKNYNIIIKDDINIMKISEICYIPYIYFFKNNNFNLNDNVQNFNYIKFIYDIRELEINLIKFKKQFINENYIINNSFFFFLKNEFK